MTRDTVQAFYNGVAVAIIAVALLWFIGGIPQPAVPAQAAAVNRVMGPQDMGSDVWCYVGSEAGVACIDMRLRAQLAALLAERAVAAVPAPTPVTSREVARP